MRMINKLVAVAALSVLGAMTSANAQSLGNTVPGDFPNPENVRIEGDLLIWDAVENAAGYNIYSTRSNEADLPTATPLTYVTTVVGETQFPLVFTGNYSVVSFNQGASLFSNQFAPQVQVRFVDGVTGSTTTGILGSSSARIFSSTCGSSIGASMCIATCPSDTDDGVLVATGGACSTSDFVPVNATAGETSYTCAAQQFTASITAQVYCSNP